MSTYKARRIDAAAHTKHRGKKITCVNDGLNAIPQFAQDAIDCAATYIYIFTSGNSIGWTHHRMAATATNFVWYGDPARIIDGLTTLEWNAIARRIGNRNHIAQKQGDLFT